MKAWKLPDHVSLDAFDYDLPAERIALEPAAGRDTSRLLVHHVDHIEHHDFRALPDCLPSNASLLFNNSKVVPARLRFEKPGGAKIEVFLLEPYACDYALAFSSTEYVAFKTLVGNKKRWRPGQELVFKASDLELTASWLDRENNIVQLCWDGGMSFSHVLEQIGNLPLPPYLNREAHKEDYLHYQTLFAREPGAVAAPTAGLHFTERVLTSLKDKGIATHSMTLHVSAGTFLPVTTPNVLDHPMHDEVFYFTEADLDYCFGSPFLIPVGTTSLRMCESLYWLGVMLSEGPCKSLSLSKLYPYEYAQNNPLPTCEAVYAILKDYVKQAPSQPVRAVTRLMITPSYKPQVARGLITNFHQPKSTLVMLVAALVGADWKTIYNEALRESYRFLSYGDSSLLLWKS